MSIAKKPLSSAPPEILAQIARDEAQRIAALWSKPLLTDSECAEALGLPDSSWQAIKKLPDAPPVFKIGGKRTYGWTEHLRAWAGAKAARALEEAAS